MAKRDFAQVQSPPKAENGHTSAIMVGLSLLLAAILAFGGGYMVGSMQDSTGTLQAEKRTLQEQSGTQQKRIGELEKQLAVLQQQKNEAKKQASDQVGDLTFYSKLPKQKVTPPPLGDTGPPAVPEQHGENVDQYADIPPPQDHSRMPIAPPKPSATQKGVATTGTVQASQAALPKFSLQLASYARRSDAEALLVRMQKIGIKGSISEVNVAGTGVRYRVIAGPYAGMAEAEGVRATVRQKLGINPMLRRD